MIDFFRFTLHSRVGVKPAVADFLKAHWRKPIDDRRDLIIHLTGAVQNVAAVQTNAHHVSILVLNPEAVVRQAHQSRVNTQDNRARIILPNKEIFRFLKAHGLTVTMIQQRQAFNRLMRPLRKYVDVKRKAALLAAALRLSAIG